MRVRELFTREGFRESLKFRPRVPPAGPPPPSPAPDPAATATRQPQTGPAVPPPALIERRDRLARELAQLQWDLGGLVYEMASRDHFRLDVIVRRAAQLQQLDAELAEVERLIRLDDAGADGACPSCGALHARGAVYCWQCGHSLMDRVKPGSAQLGGNGSSFASGQNPQAPKHGEPASSP